MEKVYKKSLYAIFQDLLRLVIAVVFVYAVIVSVASYKIAIIVSLIVSIILLILIFKGLRTKVTVTKDTLEISKGRKKYVYDIKSTHFRAEQINNDILSLIVTDINGETMDFDLTIIGVTNFNNLLEDLKIIGDNSKVIELNNKKKNNL